MIQVLMFAALREQVGASRLDFAPRHLPVTVQALVEELQARGPEWHAALGADNILCAVNQQQVAADHMVQAGDEVAFFPPVTGG